MCVYVQQHVSYIFWTRLNPSYLELAPRGRRDGQREMRGEGVEQDGEAGGGRG